MVFLGDYATVDYSEFSSVEFGSEKVVVNLEGAILNSSLAKTLRRSVLFNTKQSVQSLKKIGTAVAVIANNHFFDLENRVDFSKNYLQENGIEVCGAGNNLEEARKEVIIQENAHDYVILAFCWNVTGGTYARRKRYGVNPLTKDNVLESIRSARVKNQDATIVAIMHWGIELEKYPEPMHVQLAHDAIDAGADIVIGHHPHRIQPIEEYKGKYIFYSVGNFDIQEKKYFDGRMTYPEYSKEGLAVSIIKNSVQCKIIRKSGAGCFTVEQIGMNEALKKYKFQNVSDYGAWFKKHRVKKRGIPIFYSLDHTIRNYWKVVLLSLRHYLIHILLLFRLKKGRSLNE